MISYVKHGAVALVVATTALACGQPRTQSPRSPGAASDPEPQRPITKPKPEKPYDPVASALEPPTPQAPVEKPLPQKPFYGPGTTSPEDRAKAKADKRLTDGEVLGAAMAANEGEVTMAEVALKRAIAPDVKKFAERMKSDHGKALEQGKALAKKAKIAGADSDVSTSLKDDAKRTVEELRARSGNAFDRAYMASQVKVHKEILTVIDDRLVPSAQHADVKAMLVEMRRTVADHLASAEEIQKATERAVSSSHAKP